jgi:hypothetical protein
VLFVEEDLVVDAVVGAHVEPDVEGVGDEEHDCSYVGDAQDGEIKIGRGQALILEGVVEGGGDDEAEATTGVLALYRTDTVC